MRLSIGSKAQRRAAALVAAIALTVGACGGNSASASPTNGSGYVVLATTSVFADIAKLALGDTVTIDTIVPAGVDVHTFEPSPADAQKLTDADLIVMNGLGLDEWVLTLLESAGKSEADVLELGEDLTGFEYIEGAEEEHETGAEEGSETDEHGHGGTDPHIWLDPAGAQLYMERIAKRVSDERADLADRIATAFGEGLDQLTALKNDMSAAYAAIPAEKRKIVTFHDAFGYYARAYGITVVGVAVEAPGQDPSVQEIATLIEAIRAAGVTSIFSEVQFPSKVLDQIAAETGAVVLEDLYSDALGAAPADTYIGAMRKNAEAILASFK
jgi:ABC-type Zn uptake system ZnuABC Zn-binding protein ZnuA